MSRRLKIILVVIVVLVIIAVAVYLISIFRGKPSPQPAVNETGTTGGLPATVLSGQPLGINVPVKTSQEPATADKREQTKADLIRLAMSFVERFGSYSNQSNYQNIEDLMIYMSQDMQRWAQKLIQQGRAAKKDISIYTGVSTKALSAQVESFSEEEGTAEIKISTQKRESTGGASNSRVYNQDIKVSLVREGGIWQIDQADWQ